MSASPQPFLFAIDGGRSAFSVDRAALRRLRHEFDLLPSGALAVLDDEDGAVTRFLCRGSRDDFVCGEEFLAVAVRRYFGHLADRRLASMMYVDVLSQDVRNERVSSSALRRRVQALFDSEVPPVWRDSLHPGGTTDAVLLQDDAGRLEVLARTNQDWIYALLES